MRAGQCNSEALRSRGSDARRVSIQTVAKQDVELKVLECKMLRFLLGVTKMDKIKNWYFRGPAQVEMVWASEERSLLYWTKNVEMELPGRWKRGRPQRRLMDVVKEDMKRAGMTEVDAEDRLK